MGLDDKYGEWTEGRVNAWREQMKTSYVNTDAVDALCDLALKGLAARSHVAAPALPCGRQPDESCPEECCLERPSSIAPKPAAWRFRERMPVTLEWGEWRHVSYQPQGPANERFEFEPLYVAPVAVSAIAAIPPADPDADRFRFLIADPETGRHLLSLLQQKKGNEDSLRRMIDRIKASKAGVTADGSTERKT